MRTTIIPAQVTTIEDKIAGSLNLTQILILMIPVVWTAMVYIFFVPALKLAPYKLILIFLVLTICIVLVLRIKEKIVAEWLGVLIKYRLRPKYWVFSKNNITGRGIVIPELNSSKHTTTAKNKSILKQDDINLSDLIKFENLVKSGKVAVRYQFNKKIT